MMRWLRRYWWAATALVVVVAIGLGVFLATRPSHPARALPPARARVYTSFDACLLTDADGVGSSQAAPVWAGMQAASLQTSGKVSFLAVSGPDTAANAVPYVNTLIQRQCNLVLAVGASQVAAARQQAAVFPKVQFVVIDAGSSTPNIIALAPGEGADVTAAVKGAVTQAADKISIR
jgi:basic membrane lipoprotein Med (substrate-binding protein (PBP1-ABC) superfamily)